MKTQHIHIALIVLITGLFSTACGGAVAAENAPNELQQPEAQLVLEVSGSATTTSILAKIAPAFEADNPGYHIKTLTGTGTGGGVQGVIDGVLDVGAMGRGPKDDETPQIEYVPLGFGGEVPIAHADVPITDLTAEQIVAIFAGEVTNWSEVGGPDMPIIVYVRADDSAHTKALRTAVFGDTPFLKSCQVMGGLGDMLTAVEGTPGSIGYANYPAVVSRGVKVQPIAVDGVRPDDPSYSATLQLGFCYLPERQADMQPLAAWLQSEQGQTKLAETGVIVTQ